MIKSTAILLIGFSVCYSFILTLTHFRCNNYKDQRFAQAMGVVLVLALVGLQLSHFMYLQHGSLWVHSSFYSALLFTVAPAFYLFSKPLLKAQEQMSIWAFVHFIPVLLVFFLSHGIALPLSFLMGAFYLLWLAFSLYALRKQRDRFRIELVILGTVFVIAVGVLLLGLAMPVLSERLFFTLYTIAIGMAFVLMAVALTYAPKVTDEVVEAARETYAVSTLKHVDCESSLKALDTLMQEQKLYKENNLDLHALAVELGLTAHQLSELMNTRLGKSFSRYLREQRVTAAQRLLKEEPSASVLSIGLDVGFTSQSNFYEAFREITGTTPGKYRKLEASIAK
jgi:AraC-like DNA-binding protein